jgi:hypothetical protein
MGADKGGHGLAVPFKAKAKLQFISDELKIGRALEREKVPEKLANRQRPIWPVITTREPRTKMGALFKPEGFEPVKVSSANLEQLGGLAGIDLTLIELGEDLQQEGIGQAIGQLFFSQFKMNANSPLVEGHRRPPLRSGLLSPSTNGLCPQNPCLLLNSRLSHFVSAPT